MTALNPTLNGAVHVIDVGVGEGVGDGMGDGGVPDTGDEPQPNASGTIISKSAAVARIVTKHLMFNPVDRTSCLPRQGNVYAASEATVD